MLNNKLSSWFLDWSKAEVRHSTIGLWEVGRSLVR